MKQASRLVRTGLIPFGRKLPREMQVPHLHHTTVEVPEHLLAACVAFYEGVLGLHKVDPPERLGGTVWFSEGIHLYYGTAARQFSLSKAPAHHFALVMEDNYEEARRKCVVRGRHIADGTEYWGSRRCFVCDPADNRIELLERPPA